MKHLLLLLSVFALFKLNAQTIPTPTQTDEIIIDNGASGKADPNDRIRYKVTIQNTGAANGTGTQFNAVPDPRTTFVPGSFRSSPLAVPDAYACTGNVGIIIPVGIGVKTNDFDDNLAGTSITAGTITSANGGTVIMAADGSFDYTPPAGFTGTDNFNYTLNDGNPVGLPVPTTDVGTVTITVSNLIWFIDNSAAAGDGRRNSPFNTIAAFNAGSAAAGDVIYIEHTGTDYAGPLTLQNNERVFGEGHTGGANLSNVLPFGLAANSKALPNINGSRPLIGTAAGNGVALASNNTLRGFNIGNTSGADILGTNFGTLTVDEMTLSGTGKALDLTTGTLAATFNGVTSTSSGTQGILLSAVGGSLTTGGTTISGCTTQGILVTGSTVTANFGNTTITPGTDGVSLQNNSTGTRTFGTLSITNGSGVGFLHAVGGGLTNITGQTTITNPGGRGIDIQNAAAAKGVTFSNTNVTQSGDVGVNLQNNVGAITFADLDISPDANKRCFFASENFGILTITSGTFANTGATSIEITVSSGTTPLAISLTSVTVSAATTGILLNRTSGTFAINGSGSADGSGGAISNITARGASFINAAGITLKNITFTNASTTDAAGCGASSNASCNAAIHLDGVTGATLDNVDVSGTTQQGVNVRETSNFSLLNSTITQTGNNVEEACLYGQNLFGQATIDNCQLSFPGDRVAVIYNTSKNLDITLNGSSFNDTQTSATGADGFEMNSYGSSVTNMDVTSCTFLRDKTNAIQFITENTATGTFDVSGCTVDPGAGVGVAFDVVSNSTSTLKFNIANNPTLKGRGTSIVNCFAQGSSNMEGQVISNTVTSLGGSGTGIRSVANGDGNVKIKINGNTVSGITFDNGISCRAVGGIGRMDATISNNDVTILSTATYCINVEAGNSGSGFTNKACGNIFNNHVAPAPITGSIIGNLVVRAATPTHELLLQGPNPLTNNWDSKGNTPTSATATVLQTGTGVFTYNATCNLPSYP